MFQVTSDLNVGALVIRGSLEWTDTTQLASHAFLCAGYVAVEGDGSWDMTIQQKYAWIYIKDNGAIHSSLRSRAFGAAADDNSNDNPLIHVKGRELIRTWSLLAKPLQLGDSTMELLHHPNMMGWKVGDRIAVAPTQSRSQGSGAEFYIQNIGTNGIITLSTSSPDIFDADFIPPLYQGSKPALKSAEVVNLSRSVVISGDDFSHIPCDNTLPEAVPGEETSTLGCRCSSFRSQCTMVSKNEFILFHIFSGKLRFLTSMCILEFKGLHTIQMHRGITRIEFTRVEKCGQRGQLL